MKKLTLAFLAVTALAMLGSTTSTAQAQGLHIRSGGTAPRHRSAARLSPHVPP